MKFSDVVAISGLGGLHEIVSQRPNGLMSRPIGGDGKIKFVSNRIHTFSPLDKIAIYTDDGDSTPLLDVFLSMKDLEAGGKAPIAPKSDSNKLRAYFEEVLPSFDRERVYTSDIKKVIKWYAILSAADLVHPVEEETENEDESGSDSEEKTEE